MRASPPRDGQNDLFPEPYAPRAHGSTWATPWPPAEPVVRLAVASQCGGGDRTRDPGLPEREVAGLAEAGHSSVHASVHASVPQSHCRPADGMEGRPPAPPVTVS
ncbi:hypothetical protein GCM10010129_67930 [Streptomyces fumigatiscleroticus]|nr:hypothetical protein GCM10010129_67930 [Streptomyces fumigatiscleroticus]